MRYYCFKCGKTVKRDSKKIWIKSFCTQTQKDTRIWRLPR
jgi:ribosomal protein L37AE/L43A